MNTRDYILKCLQDHVYEKYESPNSYRFYWNSREHFVQKSYKHWAANEFLGYLKKGTNNLYEMAEAYLKQIEAHAAFGNKDQKIIFSIAYDVATDLLDFMYALK